MNEIPPDPLGHYTGPHPDDPNESTAVNTAEESLGLNDWGKSIFTEEFLDLFVDMGILSPGGTLNPSFQNEDGSANWGAILERAVQSEGATSGMSGDELGLFMDFINKAKEHSEGHGD